MTISTDAKGTPLPRANTVAQFVNPQTGTLSPHGAALMNNWHRFGVGMNRITPCDATTASNVITLTPLTASPLIEKYVAYETFGFVADATVTGPVTMTVAPIKGTLSTLNVYMQNGGVIAGAGSIVAGRFYLASYVDTLNGGAGGFVIFSQHSMLQVRDGMSYGSYDQYRCYVNPGYCSSADGAISLPLPYELTCDIRIVGLATGTPVLGTSPYVGGWLESPGAGSVPADATPLHFWFIRKTSAPNEGELALVTSTFVFASDIVPYIPAGWTYFAPAQHCITWHTGRGSHWQGFPDFFNPPRTPDLLLTGSGDSSSYRILTGGANVGTWLTHGVTSWVADSARDLIVFGRVRVAAGAASGGAWIRPNGTAGGGLPVGYCVTHATEANIAYSSDIWLRVDSNRTFQYQTSGDATLDLWLKGHRFSEPR
jgi:hypothetical protein